MMKTAYLQTAAGDRSIMTMLANDLSNLQEAVARSGTALEIDHALAPLIAHSDPSIITPILRLLNESGDQDGMWSILHAAESFEGSAYITGLLPALLDLSQSCPWWTTTLIIRVINSDADKAELVRQLRTAATPIKEAVSMICKKINEDMRFHAKTAQVLAVAEN